MHTLPPILACLLLAVLVGMSGALEQLENMSFDLRARFFAGQVSADNAIIIVYLDQYSLDWAKKELDVTWPWPREMYGLAAEFLSQSMSTTFDVLFPEPSSYGVADDRAFADVIRKIQNVVLAVVPGTVNGIGLAPELGLTGAATGSVALRPDRDGVLRHYPPFTKGLEATWPSLGLAAVQGRKFAAMSAGTDTGTRMRPMKPGQTGDLIPRFGQTGKTFRRYNAAEVISAAISLRNGDKPRLDPVIFKDRAVFFGFSAPGLFDRQATPVSASVPGVDVHAFFLKSLLDGSFLIRAPLWLDHVLAVCGGLLAGLALFFAHTRVMRFMAAIGGIVAIPVAGFLAYQYGWWIGIAESWLAVSLSISVVFSVDFIRIGRQRSFLKSAFGMYLSPTIIEKLVEKPELLRLGGERREVSVLFSDLEGFTSLAERLDPERLAQVLNEYLSVMSGIIFDEGGTIDKYEGDGIIAFWNAPVQQSDHADRALKAAVRCRDALVSLGPRLVGLAGLAGLDDSESAKSAVLADPTLRKILSRGFRMRMGVHTGEAVVGNLGSRQRFNYTVLGDTVNLASRLEGANKTFGTTILVSGAIAKAVGAEARESLRHIAKVAVVGRNAAVDVFEPVDGDRALESESFTKACELFACGDFEKASLLFSGWAPDDPVSAAYVGKCASLAERKPDVWSGVWSLDLK